MPILGRRSHPTFALAVIATMATGSAYARPGDESIVGVYDGVHPHWRDTVIISPDGTYRRGNGDPGRWTFDGKTLVLDWKNWGAERLRMDGEGRFTSRKGFSITKRVDRDDRRKRRRERRERFDREPNPTPAVAPRDCGTGPDDAGCNEAKDGRYAMDKDEFTGVMTALKATNNELVRADMAKKLLDGSRVTARQFGQLMALFNNELTRMDFVRERANRMVDPKRALGFASTFNNSLTAAEYAEHIASLR